METHSDLEFQEKLDQIFMMDEKEAFNTQLRNLIEEIENNKLQHSKIPILINFLQYKLNMLDSHQDIANQLLKKNLSDKKNPNSVIRKTLRQFCKKEHFVTTKEYMINILIDKLLEIDEITLDVLLNSIRQLNYNQNSSVVLNEANLTKFFENKFHDKNKNIKFTQPDLNLGTKKEKTLNFRDAELNNFNDEFDTKKTEFIYKLKIYYLDGADSCSQALSIISYTQIDISSFIYKLKKKLGIYEHAKFKIVILDKNKGEKMFFESITQLKLDDLNELKIVPYNYNLCI